MPVTIVTKQRKMHAENTEKNQLYYVVWFPVVLRQGDSMEDKNPNDLQILLGAVTDLRVVKHQYLICDLLNRLLLYCLL